jgi:7-cyano-7-deazaguanine synthase in queuosine biosynthesis
MRVGIESLGIIAIDAVEGPDSQSCHLLAQSEEATPYERCRSEVIRVANQTFTLDHQQDKSQVFTAGRIVALAPRLHSGLAK